MSAGSGVPGKTVPALVRSQAAVTRQEARDNRTTEQQLALLDQRPGSSARERKRLAP
jgi:hypothetical protein